MKRMIGNSALACEKSMSSNRIQWDRAEFLKLKYSEASRMRHEVLLKDFDNDKGLFSPDKWIEHRWKYEGITNAAGRKPIGWKTQEPYSFFDKIVRRHRVPMVSLLKPLNPDEIALLEGIRRHSLEIPVNNQSHVYKKLAVDEFFNMFDGSKQSAPPITAEPKWENKVENWAANNVENIKFEGSPLIEKNHMGAQVFYPSNVIGLTPKHSALEFSQPVSRPYNPAPLTPRIAHQSNFLLASIANAAAKQRKPSPLKSNGNVDSFNRFFDGNASVRCPQDIPNSYKDITWPVTPQLMATPPPIPTNFTNFGFGTLKIPAANGNVNGPFTPHGFNITSSHFSPQVNDFGEYPQIPKNY
uniref:Uncharacterized protein n=1 Tax=Acrobeloides nanus TaxID=290746 RepID=A0A914BV85_9BILA